MLEFSQPKIKVERIVEKLKDNLAKRQSKGQLSIDTASLTLSSLDGTANLSIAQIKAMLKNAESRSWARTKLPDKIDKFPLNSIKGFQKAVLKVFNLLFRDQREVNLNLIYSLQETIEINQQLVSEIGILRAHITEMQSKLDRNIAPVSSRIEIVERSIGFVEKRLEIMDESLMVIDNNLDNINESLNNHTLLASKIAESNTEIKDFVNSFSVNYEQRLQAIDQRILQISDRQEQDSSYLKSELGQQRRLSNAFIQEAKSELPKYVSEAQLTSLIDEQKHELDSLYIAFEERFRGARDEIRNRLKVYLPLLAENTIAREYPMLDLGCGRGEWLELLKDNGFTALGIDINTSAIAQCRNRHLEVIQSDAIQYLKSLPESSISLVTGFHIIEHLPFETLIELLDEIVRVLHPGGLTILETPNPENVLVGSHTFYLDPTHKNPLPSLVTQFLAEMRGLSKAEILKLHPYPQESRVSGSDLAERFNEHFYGAQDYALVAYKA